MREIDSAEYNGVLIEFMEDDAGLGVRISVDGRPIEDSESLRRYLSLYHLGSIESRRGYEIRFHGRIPEFSRFERFGYSTNHVVATENFVMKTYRYLGSREPHLFSILSSVTPKML